MTDWTRTDYMEHRVDHHTYYLGLADLIGRAALEQIVLQIADRDRLRAALAEDPHLNTIPLAAWDRRDPIVRDLVANNSRAVMARSWNGEPLPPKTFCWSLSESVCVLKAVARQLAQSEVSDASV